MSLYSFFFTNLNIKNIKASITTIAITIPQSLYAKFYHDMDKRLGKFWPGLVLSVVCVGVVVALVGLVGYFPVGEAPVRLPWDG